MDIKKLKKNEPTDNQNKHRENFIICLVYFYKMATTRLISFDVGIKHMAYCIFEFSDTQPIQILDWNVLNLLSASSAEEKSDNKFKTCNCLGVPAKKNTLGKVCGKKAKYYKGDHFYCDKHAKKATTEQGYLMPCKEFTLPFLKKQKLDVLSELEKKYYGILFAIGEKAIDQKDQKTKEKQNKNERVENIYQFLEKKTLNKIETKKTKTANEIDLIQIGRNMTAQLDTNPLMNSVTKVIIENQISPIANRMKTIQGMVTQYFIMKCGDKVNIEYISSFNKLRAFHKDKEPEEKEEKTVTQTIDNMDKKEYKKHKTDGIVYCRQEMDSRESLHKWKTFFESFDKKRDDLADSFLQGIWYIEKRKK